jgi:D-arabinose 1-dehydrogenase-like Zn-dependent alcohol dehydrogenase
MSSSTAIPSTSRALVFADSAFSVKDVITPQAGSGSVLVQVLVSTVAHSLNALMSGGVPGLISPSIFIPGSRAIGRIAAVGPDTTTLQVGQLVVLEPFVHGRDNPEVNFLLGFGVFGGDSRAIKLQQEYWKDGSMAEYVRAPLENTYPLDEKLLLGSPTEGGLGYTIADLLILERHMVAYGGLRGINLQAGETIVIAPATGAYSGAAVDVAIAMGARVIALGRNMKALEALAATHPRVNILQLKNNFEEDLAALKRLGTIDAYLDISPSIAKDSTHVRSCFMAVKPYGRVSLMGVLNNDIAIPYVVAVIRNLSIKGQYMYEREDVRGVIKMAEAGVLKLGKVGGHEIVGNFTLGEIDKAFEVSKANAAAGQITVVHP